MSTGTREQTTLDRRLAKLTLPRLLSLRAMAMRVKQPRSYGLLDEEDRELLYACAADRIKAEIDARAGGGAS